MKRWNSLEEYRKDNYERYKGQLEDAIKSFNSTDIYHPDGRRATVDSLIENSYQTYLSMLESIERQDKPCA